ncbi:MAG: peptidoglycan editing factor PgeF [Acidobacteriia bacterium]|nr:peptidoglycan editing factor PgeF [Terriglobia bacterium]
MPRVKRQPGKPLPRSRPSRPAIAVPWRELRKGGLHVLQAAPLAKLPWLVHGFSTRPGGVSDLDGEKILNLGFSDWDTRENVLENRKRFLRAAGVSPSDVMTLAPLKQIHSDIIRLFDAPSAEPCRGDASATDRPGLLLAVQTADCVPILLVDPRRRAVAAIHAGWRGTLRRIAEKTAGLMRMRYGSRPADLLAAIGPSIGPCCYDVGTEIARDFDSQFARAADFFDELRTGDEPNPLQWLNQMPPGHQPPPKNVFLDLRKANQSQLLDAGLRPKNIFTSSLCTACHPDLLFSYRKQGPRSGRLMSIVGIRK